MNGLAEAGIVIRRHHPGEHRTACPECAKLKSRSRDDALAVKIEAGGGALWLCQRCGWKGGISGKRGAMPRACQAAIEAFAPTEPEKPIPNAARRLWGDCRPIGPGTIAATYLEARGCALPHPGGDLRWHPSHRHPDGYTGPALVALVTDAITVEPMTLHRTWITATGKADIARPRLLWPGGRKKGGCTRLWPDDEITLGLAIAEGMETALTVARVFPAAWAVVDAGNMADFPVLPGVECLTIVADHDAHGRGVKVAEACADRWRQTGVEAVIWRSPVTGEDLNDWSRP
jgi:hypothetical protein